jgi:hypothetical protein
MRGKRGVLAVTFLVVEDAPDFWDLFLERSVLGWWELSAGERRRFVLSHECPHLRVEIWGTLCNGRVAGLLVQQFVRLEACC